MARVNTSPRRRPARSAGPPAATSVTSTPPAAFQSSRRPAPATSKPTQARRTLPLLMISSATRRARSIGIAKPSPIDPPFWVKIELFTPMT